MSDDATISGGDPAGRGGVVYDLIDVVPRLVIRTQAQFELARRAIGSLPCVGRLARHAPKDTTVDTPAPPSDVDVLSVLDETLVDAAEPSEPGTAEPVAASADGPSEADLAVPGYDSLAASQVVPRLAALSPDDLSAIQQYELSHRRRQTILNRIAQLLAA